MKTSVESTPQRTTDAIETLAATVGVDDIVETVKEFGAASLELVAWEFSLPPRVVDAPWRQAVERGLIAPVGRCPDTYEQMFVPQDGSVRADAESCNFQMSCALGA